jgi:FKBP-type peptidyl-prolyl cis-trans isomerase FkpA
MTKHIFLTFFAILLSSSIITSCDDGSKEIQKEKELRLLKLYLEAKNITVEPETNGMFFVSQQAGTGLRPEPEHWVIIRYTAKTVNDLIFDTTDEKIARDNYIYTSAAIYGDRRIPLASLGIRGLTDGLRMMKEGGRATLIIPSHLGYGGSGTGNLPPYTTLVYDVELIRVITDPVQYEQQMIDNYLNLYADSTHLVVQAKENGLYYIEISEGTGENFPAAPDEVGVFYRGTFTDGREFDSNAGGSEFWFSIGSNQAIPGFEEGVKLMKKGGKSRVLIPSSLGYGPLGSGIRIVGYTPLVFDLELVDIR